MPAGPPPMSVYHRLHDPVAHAKSEQDAMQAYSVVTVDPLTSSSYGAFARRPATVSDTRSRRSRRSKGSSGLGLRERDPNRPHSVSGSRSSGDSFFERASSRNSSRNSTGDQKPHELDAAGSTGWRFRSGGFREKPRYRTQGEMQEARAKAMLPDPSFDVDGDGVVSSTDYYLSSQFDVDKDGHIDDDERAALRKTMVDALVRKYRAVPKVENKETAEMIKMFTKDLDRTVNKSTFMQDFNKLYSKTASAQAFDSTQIFGVLCPEQMQAHEKRKGGSKAQPHNKTGIAARLIDAPTRASARDTLMIGSTQQRWGGLASRKELLKTRKQQKDDAARQWNHDYCATFPPAGCVRQHVPVEGPPGVRPSSHHAMGVHAPLL